MVISNYLLKEDYRMKTDSIDKYVKMLVTNLTFNSDYNNFVNGTKRLLIVEGQTDKNFIEKILNKDIVCIVASKAFGFKNVPEVIDKNCKAAIMQVVYGLSEIPILISCPKDAEKWIVFGMIDLDNDDSERVFLSTSRLFVTDTHDLETLLLSTDEELLQRLDMCSISIEDAQNAFCLAYQLGLIRQILIEKNESELKIEPICCGGRYEVDFTKFVENGCINVKKLIEYVFEKNNKQIVTAEIEKLIKKVCSDKRIKKQVNNGLLTNVSWKEMSSSKQIDFWKEVNGHDILSILRYVNNDAAIKYYNYNETSLNRSFEIDLINKYDYENLEKTKIYQNMLEENVITKVVTSS